MIIRNKLNAFLCLSKQFPTAKLRMSCSKLCYYFLAYAFCVITSFIEIFFFNGKSQIWKKYFKKNKNQITQA